MTALKEILADTRPLRESLAYRRLWIGQSVSAVGNMMTGVVVSLQVYQLSHSSLAVGLVGLVEAVPILVLGLLGGAWADTLDKRTLALWTSVGMSLVSALFTVQAATGLHSLAVLYILAAVQAGLSALSMPAVRAMLPVLLPRERIAAAAALSQLTFQASLVLGPLVAGFLTEATSFTAAYLIDAASFLALIYAAIRLPVMAVQRATAAGGSGSESASVLGGLRFVARQPILSTVLALDLTSMLFGMPMALFPAFAQHQYGGGSATAGLLYASPAIGGMIGGAFSGPLSRIRARGAAILAATAIWGLGVIAFGFSRVLWLGMPALALAGCADMVNGALRSALIQLDTPKKLLGRVNAVGFVNGELGPSLGNLEAGAVASAFSPTISAVSGGIACVAGVLIALIARPALLRYRSDDSADVR